MKLSKSSNLTQAKRLYREAFPREERLPWWILRLMTLQKGVELSSFYDGAEFCGFAHTAATEDTVYIMFFAVNERLRNRGYGSAILTQLKQIYSDKTIILNVEPPDEQADNAQQRVNRMRFYMRNGFYDTGYNSTEVGGIFRVLSTSPELDISSYLKVFHKISFGFWKPKVTSAK